MKVISKLNIVRYITGSYWDTPQDFQGRGQILKLNYKILMRSIPRAQEHDLRTIRILHEYGGS